MTRWEWCQSGLSRRAAAWLWLGLLLAAFASCHELDSSLPSPRAETGGAGTSPGGRAANPAAGDGGLPSQVAGDGSGGQPVIGQGGDASHGGDPAQGGGGEAYGANGGAYGSEDVDIGPDCVPFPAVVVPDGASSIAAAPSRISNQFRQFVIRAESNWTLIRWRKPDAKWADWACFEQVPHAKRIVAGRLSEDSGEVFVVTDLGKVFVTREYGTWWGSWIEFNLPREDAFITDLAVSHDDQARSYVFALDDGWVLYRYKVSDDENGNYSAWRRLGQAGGTLLTAARRNDGRQQVFALDDSGHPLTAVQTSADLGAGFGEWTSLRDDTLGPLIDLDAIRLNDGNLWLLGIDEAGTLWGRTADGEGWGSWQAWPGPAQPAALIQVAAARASDIAGAQLLVTVLTTSSQLYSAPQKDGVWGDWSP